MIKVINFFIRTLKSKIIHSISVDPTASNLDWQTGDYDDIAVNVTPDSMSVTVSKIDTGDGTTWFGIDHTSATGDFTLRISALKDNTGTSKRNGQVKLEDDSDSTIIATIEVSQIQQPT